MSIRPKSLTHNILLLATTIAVAACSSGSSTATASPGPGGGGNNNGGGNNGGGNPTRPSSLEGTLQQFGVATTATTREIAPGVTVPAGYAPLGATPALTKTSELLLFGIGREPTLANHPLVLHEVTGPTGQAVNDVLHAAEPLRKVGREADALVWDERAAAR